MISVWFSGCMVILGLAIWLLGFGWAGNGYDLVVWVCVKDLVLWLTGLSGLCFD